MDTMAYLLAMALLGIGMTLAQSGQSAKPSSDPSNSADSTVQTQNGPATEQPQTAPRRRRKDKTGESSVPDSTIRDQQSSTTSTTGAAGEDNTSASPSTMGTTGSTPDR